MLKISWALILPPLWICTAPKALIPGFLRCKPWKNGGPRLFDFHPITRNEECLQHDPCQNNRGGGHPANFILFVLFMFDFSSCCCELMASNAVLLRTFLPLCPAFWDLSVLAVSDSRVCTLDLLQPRSGVGGDREKRAPEHQNRVCVSLTRAWSTAMRSRDLEKRCWSRDTGQDSLKQPQEEPLGTARSTTTARGFPINSQGRRGKTTLRAGQGWP